MQVFAMEVSKTENKKYVKVGTVPIFYPTVEEIAGFCQGAKVVKTGEDGIAEYESPEANWIQTAIFSYAKANARNKLVSGSCELKDGLKIPEFTDWISKQGKSEVVTKTLITYFNNRAALELQSATNKGKMQTYVETFAESLSPEKLERLQKPIEAVLEACAAAEVLSLD